MKIKIYLQLICALILIFSIVIYELRTSKLPSFNIGVIFGLIGSVIFNPIGWIAIALFLIAYRNTKILKKVKK
jgi:hypothetical protein